MSYNTIRQTGSYLIKEYDGEAIQAFVPFPLPPIPPLEINNRLEKLLEQASQNCRLLNLASQMVPDRDWFIYGFVYKEAVVSSQIEGTQATLMDVLSAASNGSDEGTSADIEEIVNYVQALKFCLNEISDPRGLPLSLRIIKKAHAILMRGVRGEHKSPGEFRRSQNWIGGDRPGNAKFVPPPVEKLASCLDEFEKYLYSKSTLDPIIRAGLIHVQFETIHPFLDGNGRVGRLLITLLLTEWKVLEAPLLYLSVHFKKNRNEYYQRLSEVRTEGNWEEWITFFLQGVSDVACESAQAARSLFEIVLEARQKVISHRRASIVSLKLLETLPKTPIVSVGQVTELLSVTKPTAQKAIDLMLSLNILEEISGKGRGKRFAFKRYLDKLKIGTEVIDES